MTRSIANKFRLVRNPIHLQEAPDDIRNAIVAHREKHGRDPSPYELAAQLDISRARAQRVFLSAVRSVSLDHVGDDDHTLGETLAAAPETEDHGTNDAVRTALGSLTPREREVVQMRFGLGDASAYTLEDIGRIYNLSRERVRQIELRALEKLRHPSRADRLRAILETID